MKKKSTIKLRDYQARDVERIVSAFPKSRRESATWTGGACCWEPRRASSTAVRVRWAPPGKARRMR